MNFELDQVLLILGRFLLGGLFVYGGVSHMFAIPELTQAIAARGVPAPRLVLLIGSAFQVVAGLLLILGLFVVPAAFALVLFTFTASVMLVNFWDMEGHAREAAINVWLSNFAVIGGLLITAAHAM